MEDRKEKIAMLNLMQQPAFYVEAGVITHANPAAENFFLAPGTPVDTLIHANCEEYASFTEGCLYMPVEIGGQTVNMAITRSEGWEVWMPEQDAEAASLRAMALAAAELRDPLSGAISAAEQLLPALSNSDPQLQQQAAQVNRRLMQLMRSICNMSDAIHYTGSNGGRMECVEICAFVAEIMEKSAHLAERSGISLHYQLPNELIFTMADTEKLERSIFNLLSNAMKCTPQGEAVEVQLQRRGQRLYLSFTDVGTEPILGNIFTRFQREPGLHDRKWGIGLGMVLVRSVAAMHGGAVLVDRPNGKGNRVTLSMAITQANGNQLRSPVLRIDYAGEWDHCLLELSDVLSSELYINHDTQ